MIYIRNVETHKVVNEGRRGYDKILDVRVEIGSVAIHDFIVEFAWKESIPKREQLSVDAQKVVTSATVEIFEAGFGWSKLQPAPGVGGEGEVKPRSHFIQFEKRFLLTLTIPSPGDVLEKVGISKIIPIRIAGVLDILTQVANIEVEEF